MNVFRYSLAELFLLIAYCAVIAWCFRFNWMIGMLGLGAFIGFESGRKTRYAIFLMVPAGLLMATMFIVAIGGVMGIRFGSDQSLIQLLEQRLAKAGQVSAGMVALDVTVWLCAIATLVWFLRAWSTVNEVNRSGEKGTRMRAELESIVNEKREAIGEGLASESDSLDVGR